MYRLRIGGGERRKRERQEIEFHFGDIEVEGYSGNVRLLSACAGRVLVDFMSGASN
jgi:hypothetical protein